MALNIRFEAIVPKKKISQASMRDVMSSMRGMSRKVQRKLMKYPPRPPASTYRRTGDLGRNWTVRGPSRKGPDLVVEVGNKIKYGPYVEGPEGTQTRQHSKTGWPRIDEVGEEEWTRAEPEIRKALQK